MTIKDETLQKAQQFLEKKGSFPYRVCKLLKEGDFDKMLSSGDLTHLLNEGAGKKVKPNNLTASMEPLVKEDIVKVKIIGRGRNKKKFWFPGWIDKNTVKQNNNRNIFDELKICPEIRSVSEKLFLDGHYAQAIFEAYKKINNMVKENVDFEDDGKSLMLTAFNENNPHIKLNPLKTITERNEQEGFKFLTAGAMMFVRNPKAHDNVVQKDPIKATQYIAFANILAEQIKTAKRAINKKNQLYGFFNTAPFSAPPTKEE